MSFEEWWKNESGWGGELLSEGKLAKEAWNAAIDEAIKEIKDNYSDITKEEEDNGYTWQRDLPSHIVKTLQALKEEK